MKNSTRRVALMGLATTLALTLSYIEAILPPISGVAPGIKMGLANIVIIFCLYKIGWREACLVSLLRLALMFLLFGNVQALAYSFAGAVLSLTAMILLKQCGKFSLISISIVGGILHNVGQILMAILILGVKEIAYYMIVLAISGTVAGVLVGLSSVLMLRYTQRLQI